MEQASLQETHYSDLIFIPYVSIEMNRARFQSTSIPEVRINTVPPNNTFKFKYCDSDDKSWCGYDSDN